jgi:hypothetical protein
MGLSLLAMVFAAAGYIVPVAGAVLQEGIDALVILNALRALGDEGLTAPRKPEAPALAQALASTHRVLRPYVGELASLAARLELLKGEDPTGPLMQTHHEIHSLTRLYGRLVAQLPAKGPRTEDLRDLRRVLYGLHAILLLHFAQEDELYSLFEPS